MREYTSGFGFESASTKINGSICMRKAKLFTIIVSNI